MLMKNKLESCLHFASITKHPNFYSIYRPQKACMQWFQSIFPDANELQDNR